MPKLQDTMPKTDILICGAGIIGLSLALELSVRGKAVTVVETAAEGGRVQGQASWAAAGMLAVDDPHNPAELHALSRWSRSLYDEYLDRVGQLSHKLVSYQTERTLQYAGDGSCVEFAETSVNPREVMTALEAAAPASGGHLIRHFRVADVREEEDCIIALSSDGRSLRASQIVYASGAWASGVSRVVPRKGQMMRVRLQMDIVHRAEDIYVVPRRFGEQAGTCVVGATVEDAGFDTTVQQTDLAWLRERAARLVPEVRGAEVVEAWAGLRPATPSGLPVLGSVPGTKRQWVAGGHFRNGILLAPATAWVLADLIEGRTPTVDLSAFAPLSRERTIAQSGR